MLVDIDIYHFSEWSKLTLVSDEMVIPTLARVSEITEVTGGWTVKQQSSPLPRYHFQVWHRGCRGKLRHGVCVFSLADLSTILRSQSIVINKVMTKHDVTIGECLRDSVRQREILEPG